VIIISRQIQFVGAMSKAVALTGSAGLGPFEKMCRDIGDGVLQRLLAAENCPPSLIAPGARLPLLTMCGLFDRAARAAGDELFGLHLGQRMTLEDFGPWARYAAKADQLPARIARMNRTLPYHQPGAMTWLSIRGDVAIWRYRPSVRAAVHYRHHADHVIWPMVRNVTRYVGPDWKPLWIEVGYDRPRSESKLEDALGARVDFASTSATFGVAFPADFLGHAPMTPSDSDPALADLRELVAARAPYGTRAIVRELFLFGEEDHERSLANISRILRLSPRSLRRALQAEGRSFSELLEMARFEEARRLLSFTDMTIADVGSVPRLRLRPKLHPRLSRMGGNRSR
jgi:AraC-like DNA-binding protein